MCIDFISRRGLLSRCTGVIDVLPFVCNMAAARKVFNRLLGEEYVILIYSFYCPLEVSTLVEFSPLDDTLTFACK